MTSRKPHHTETCRRDVPVGVPLDLSTPTGMSCIVTCQMAKIASQTMCQNIMLYLRNRSALAVNCCLIIHCLEVSRKEDQITRAVRE